MKKPKNLFLLLVSKETLLIFKYGTYFKIKKYANIRNAILVQLQVFNY